MVETADRRLEDIAQEAVDLLGANFGRHDGCRAVHAKGVFCRGTFVATPEAAALTRAPHMQGAAVATTVRFSNAHGHPRRKDSALDGRGMAVKFELRGGGQTDIVSVTLPSFLARTPEEFLEFVRASRLIAGEIPSPKLALYLATHRHVFPGLSAAIRAKPPVSFATRRYNALHAFNWIGADETRQAVRYSWIPEAGEHSLSLLEARKKDRDYLIAELGERLGREPIRFGLEVQVAGPEDATHDSTRAWPDERERVRVGTLELTEPMADPEGDGNVVVFDPVNVCDGIELSDDPLPQFRSLAYSVSVERRMSSA